MTAMRMLKTEYGDRFAQVFKTITVDNGSEFADFARCESWGTEVFFAPSLYFVRTGAEWTPQRIIPCVCPQGDIHGASLSWVYSVSCRCTECASKEKVGVQNSGSRAYCMIVMSGLRRTIFTHAGVQLALAICIFYFLNITAILRRFASPRLLYHSTYRCTKTRYDASNSRNFVHAFEFLEH